MGVTFLIPCSQDTRNSFGFNFELLSHKISVYIEPFLELLPRIRDVTIAIDCFLRTDGVTPVVWEVIELGNWVQYHLLCLEHHSYDRRSRWQKHHQHQHQHQDQATPKRNLSFNLNPNIPPTNGTSASPLRILQLASLVYSDLVIFPLAFASGMRYKLARTLHRSLKHLPNADEEYYDGAVYFLDDTKLELWVLSMGYIACLPHASSSVAVYFKSRLREILDVVVPVAPDEEGGHSRYERYLDIMRGWLWWDVVLDGYARDLWRDLCGADVSAAVHADVGVGDDAGVNEVREIDE